MNIHKRLELAKQRVVASAGYVKKAKMKKEGWLVVEDTFRIENLTEKLIGGADARFSALERGYSDYFNQSSQGFDFRDYKDKETAMEHTDRDSTQRGSPYVPTYGQKQKDGAQIFEGQPISMTGTVDGAMHGVRAIPWFKVPDLTNPDEIDVNPVEWAVSFQKLENGPIDREGNAHVFKARGSWDNLSFNVAVKDAIGRYTIKHYEGFSNEEAANFVADIICGLPLLDALLGKDCLEVWHQATATVHVVYGDADDGLGSVDSTDIHLLIYSDFESFVANNYEPDWEASMNKMYPKLQQYVDAGKVKITAMPKQLDMGAEVSATCCGEVEFETVVEGALKKALIPLNGVKKSIITAESIKKANEFIELRADMYCAFHKAEDVEEVEDAEDAEDAEEETESTEDETMDTPEEVQKAMRLIKAWNAFKKEAENGVTSGAQFNMDGANDSEGENPSYSQQDANDLVDEEYETETSGSAIDATGLAGEDMIADEDMTVDSADAVSAVPAVAKSMRRLMKALVRKAEEANPEMTEEQKEEVEDAAAEDLKDPEATTAIAECMKAEGDEELADKLEDHAELLDKAMKSLFAKNEGSVGAVALPSEEVGVATESVVDKAGEQNDTDMPSSAVDEAGTDKIDVSADLDDHEAAKVEEEPEKENPGYILPEDDVPMQAKTVSDKSEAEDKELAKAYDMLGAKKAMSITDMIAMKRGQRIETADAAEESAEEGSIEVFKPSSAGPHGYRPVELGRGKTMIPPFKH